MQTIFYYLAQRVFTILSCLSDNFLIPIKKSLKYIWLLFPVQMHSNWKIQFTEYFGIIT